MIDVTILLDRTDMATVTEFAFLLFVFIGCLELSFNLLSWTMFGQYVRSLIELPFALYN